MLWFLRYIEYMKCIKPVVMLCTRKVCRLCCIMGWKGTISIVLQHPSRGMCMCALCSPEEVAVHLPAELWGFLLLSSCNVVEQLVNVPLP